MFSPSQPPRWYVLFGYRLEELLEDSRTWYPCATLSEPTANSWISQIPTTTVTKTISEVAIPSKSATGYCWNGQQDLLTPCTELLLPTATPKTNAAIRVNNPVQHLMSIVKRSRLASNVQRDPCPYNLLILILGVSFLCFEVIAVHLVWGPQLSRRPSLRIAMLSQVIICGLLVGLAYHFRVAGRRC